MSYVISTAFNLIFLKSLSNFLAWLKTIAKMVETLFDKLNRIFPSIELLDAFGIMYSQYWNYVFTIWKRVLMIVPNSIY